MKQIRNRPILIILFLTSSIVIIVNGAINEETGIVSWITDGDTFDINYVTYRMADIDAPEMNETGGPEAKDYLFDLIYNKIVFLDIDDIYETDPFDRFVCVVYIDYNSTHYLNVNKLMVNAGHADLKNYDNEFNPYSWNLFYEKTSTPTPNISPSPSTTPTLEPTITSSPTPSPNITPTTTPTISGSPTPSINPVPFGFSSPNLIIAGSISLLVGLGILAYFKKYRK